MKKKDFILILLVLLLALASLGIYQLSASKNGSDELEITVDGEVYGRYSLLEDKEISINNTNGCIIEKGVVSMVWSACPDHLCQKQKSIDSRGGTIVCIPNKVVLSIREVKAPEVDAMT